MKRGLTGLAAWVVQRAGAIYMLCFAIFAVAAVTVHPRHSYAEWKAWVSSDAMSAGIGLFLLALLTHMWVGLRDVLLDYVKPEGVRRVSLLLLGMALLSVGMWALQILVHAHT
ncbi:MAG: succinate dehydrogenase, hydrophobic membrane anchor protein [Burkholderiales bacterium]|nr:succinate dehydrogenase, hydrophobic membrane anchor protein [Burkholderiales bacterium]